MKKICGLALREKIVALTTQTCGEEVSTLSDKVSWLAREVNLTSRTLRNYLSGKIPEKIPKLRCICAALGCHPSELLLPSERLVYEGLLLDLQYLRDTVLDVQERNLATVRLSREILRWQKFFTTGRFEDVRDPDVEAAEQEHTLEIEREVAKRALGI